MSKHLEHRNCFYCDAIYVTSKSSIGDHFPVPQRLGGTATVPCCRECHSLKDRISLGSWNNAMLSKVFLDWPKMSRETRLFLAKCAVAIQEANEINRSNVV
jgi:hypothetical protein